MLQPGVVAGLVPWWLTGWQLRHRRPSWEAAPLRVAGVVLLGACALVAAVGLAMAAFAHGYEEPTLHRPTSFTALDPAME